MRLRAQLDARSERLRVLEPQLTSREADIEDTRRKLQAWDEKLAIEDNELALEHDRLHKREEAAPASKAHYQRSVESINARLAEREEEQRRRMLAGLQNGRESYRKELREEYASKCKVQEDRFKERNRELEVELENLKLNLDRVRRERGDEKRARRCSTKEVKRLKEELDSLQAQIAPVAEQAAERWVTADHTRELSRLFQS